MKKKKKKKNHVMLGAVSAIVAVSSLASLDTPLSTNVAEALPIQTEISQVQNVKAESTNVRAADVTWDGVPGATRYRVQAYVENESGEFIKDGGVRTTILPKYTPKTLKAGRTYKFEITPYSTISKKYLAEKAALSNVVTLTSPDSENGDTGATAPDDNPTIVPNVSDIQVVAEGKTAKVTWGAITGAKRYRIQMYEKNASGDWVTSGGVRTATTNSFKSSTLKEGTSYKFEITPYVNLKYVTASASTSSELILEGSTSDENNGAPAPGDNPTTVPNVSGIQVVAEGKTAKVTWGAITGAKRYRIQMYEKNAAGNWVTSGGVRTTTTNSFKSSTLKEGASYKFEITPYVNLKYVTASASTSSEFTLGDSASDKDIIQDGDDNGGPTNNEKVANIEVTFPSDGQSVNVSWNAFANAKRYRVQAYVEAGNNFEPFGSIRTTTSTNIEMTGLQNGQTYHIVVTPYVGTSYSEGNKGTSQSFIRPNSIIPPVLPEPDRPTTPELPTYPTAPVTNAKLVLGEENKATVSWDAYPNATRYDVQLYEKNSFGAFEKVSGGTTTSSTSYTKKLTVGKTYQFRIVPYVLPHGYITQTAVTTNAVTVAAPEPEVVTPISNLTATLTNQKVMLKWDAKENVSRYQVYTYILNESTNQFEKQASPRSTSTSYLNTTTLEKGKSYKFEVIPNINYEYNQSGAAMSQVITIPSATPSEPTTPETTNKVKNVRATGNGLSATITWDNFTSATKYQVQAYVKDNATNSYTKTGAVKTATTNKLEGFTMKDGETYRFVVTPYVSSYVTESAGSSEPITANAEQTGNAPKVTNIKSNVSGTTVLLTWDAFSNATRYKIQPYVKDETGKFVASGSSRTSTLANYNVPVVERGKTYQFEITPYVNGQYVNDSKTLSSDVSIPSVPPISNIRAQFKDGNSATVTWGPAAGATRYKVQAYKKTNTGDYQAFGSASTTSSGATTTISNLEYGANYKFVVTPYIGSQYVTESEGSSGDYNLPMPNPTPIMATALVGTAELSWVPIPGIERYQVITYKENSYGSYTTSGSPRTVTGSGLQLSLTKGQRYKFDLIPYVNGSFNESLKSTSSVIQISSDAIDNTAPDGGESQIDKKVKNLTASLYGETSAYVSWSSFKGVTKFYVQPYMYGMATGSRTLVTGTSTVINGLQQGSTYTFKVTPYEHEEGFELSDAAETSNSVSIPLPPPPPPPVEDDGPGYGGGTSPGYGGGSGGGYGYDFGPISAEFANGGTRVTLSWNSTSSIDRFKVDVYKKDTGGLVVTRQTSSTSLSVTGLDSTAWYTVVITPRVNGSFNSSYAIERDF